MLRVVGLVALGAALVGCAPVDSTSVGRSTSTVGAPAASTAYLVAYSDQLQAASTSQLCATYGSPALNEQTRLMIEAELGARGISECNGSNIGVQSASQVSVTRFARSGSNTGVGGQDRNCGDFGSAAEAQRFFLASGGPSSDPHNLDGDGDGAACEWGTEVRSLAMRHVPRIEPPAPVRSTPRSSASGCFVGPRGGTYTITASGNRNYDGC